MIIEGNAPLSAIAPGGLSKYSFSVGNRIAWLKAARPASQSYIFFPLLFGQLLSLRSGVPMNWTTFVLVQLFGVFDQLYIVFANDWSDVEADMRNTTFNIFSGGSRVLVNGELNRRDVGIAALITASLAVLTGAGMWITSGSFIPFVLAIFGLLLLQAYSLFPARLNYRGGGELLQMIGVGGVLVLIGYSAQAGTLIGFCWWILAVTLPVSLSCAIATSLPDEPSDRYSFKRSAGVIIGPKPVAYIAIVLIAVSLAAWIMINPLSLKLAFRVAVSAVPTAALLFAVFHLGGTAGSRRLNMFVTGIVAATVLLFVALSVISVVA